MKGETYELVPDEEKIPSGTETRSGARTEVEGVGGDIRPDCLGECGRRVRQRRGVEEGGIGERVLRQKSENRWVFQDLVASVKIRQREPRC